MVDEITAKFDLGPVGKGVSKSHYFLCTDGREYIVKFDQPRQKTIINELVAGTLAMLIQLPAPGVAIVNITKEFLTEATDELRNKNIRVGKHMGIRRLPQKTWDFDYWTDEMLRSKNPVNVKDIYGTICFDNWVMNSDRNNMGNNMLESIDKNSIKYWMVDLGHCFLHNMWTKQDLGKHENDETFGVPFPFMRDQIVDVDGFVGWFDTLEDVQDAEIDGIMDSIPPNWPANTDEKQSLRRFIKLRKQMPRKVICDKEDLFDNA